MMETGVLILLAYYGAGCFVTGLIIGRFLRLK